GFVKTADARPIVKECTVELAPVGATARDLGPGEMARAALTGTLVKASDRGFFHFDAITPGSYVLTARLPGYAPARIFPVMVIEDAEAALREPLTLAPPLTFRVLLKPQIDPRGRPWLVDLYQYGATTGQLERVAGLSVADDGTWQATGLAPGRYDVSIQDQDHSRWVEQTIDLDQESGPFEIVIPVVPVEGSVTLGHEPLECAVWFGGIRGEVSIHFVADREGHFHGYLPHEGSWAATVASKSPPVRRQLEKVEVRREGGVGTAKVEITLPNTVIEGTVVDADQRPVAGANVSCRPVLPKEPPEKVYSDSEGRFVFWGFPPGQVVLEAASGDMTSEPAQVQLAEGSKSKAVQLVLRKVSQLAGRVFGPRGPVLGARVEAFPIGRPSAGSGDVTGVDGHFAMAVPSWAGEVALVVFPPGFALHVERLAISHPQKDEVIVQVDSSLGILALRLGTAKLDPTRFVFFVVHNGTVLGPALLAEWTRMNNGADSPPGVYRIPALEPGQYWACTASIQYMPALLANELPGGAQCGKPGYLSPNGELTLELPAPQ
ncbi:MAG TPA: carboxypeptidase-like regulatory domain-containing protein, partial [Thermoanaerobaculaceae bacterium]|nr:carboxypeptidase-like regulatory domain-containing protein [Thermoanaerobaculaceae bacterium]